LSEISPGMLPPVFLEAVAGTRSGDSGPRSPAAWARRLCPVIRTRAARVLPREPACPVIRTRARVLPREPACPVCRTRAARVLPREPACPVIRTRARVLPREPACPVIRTRASVLPREPPCPVCRTRARALFSPLPRRGAAVRFAGHAPARVLPREPACPVCRTRPSARSPRCLGEAPLSGHPDTRPRAFSRGSLPVRSAGHAPGAVLPAASARRRCPGIRTRARARSPAGACLSGLPDTRRALFSPLPRRGAAVRASGHAPARVLPREPGGGLPDTRPRAVLPAASARRRCPVCQTRPGARSPAGACLSGLPDTPRRAFSRGSLVAVCRTGSPATRRDGTRRRYLPSIKVSDGDVSDGHGTKQFS